MNQKSIITAVLLVFVIASAAYLIVKDGNGDSGANPGRVESVQAASAVETTAVSEADNPASNPAPERKVMVYYFHGARRCYTCNRIEEMAREAVQEGLAPQIEAGLVEFQSINIDEPANAHYRQDFELAFSSLIVAETNGEGTVRWQNLQDVWKLVRGSQEDYNAYVQKAISEYLGG